MNSFYVMLSSLYFKYSLNKSLFVPIYGVYRGLSSVLLMSKKVKNGLKGACDG